MMYKCNECGAIFDEDDADYVREEVGEFWGTPAYMDFMKCPECGADDDGSIEEYNKPDEEEEDDEDC